jgi:hypothetical protein
MVRGAARCDGRRLPAARQRPSVTELSAIAATVAPRWKKRRAGQLLVVCIQRVVHVPEPALGAGGLGGHFRVRMCRRERKVAEHRWDDSAGLCLDCIDDRMRGRAIGTFILSIFHQHNRRIDPVLGCDPGLVTRAGSAQIATSLCS